MSSESVAETAKSGTTRIDEFDYQTKTYTELSQNFKTTYGRACDLIPLMYNRLTKVDGISHKKALTTIFDDHKDLPGFSYRNIHRSLPTDNPTVPRRVVTSRHKNSDGVTDGQQKLSITENNPPATAVAANYKESVQECPDCSEYKRQLQEVTEALEKSTKITTADKLKPLEGIVPKAKQQIVMKAFQKSKQLTHLIFDLESMLFDARPDT